MNGTHCSDEQLKAVLGTHYRLRDGAFPSVTMHLKRKQTLNSVTLAEGTFDLDDVDELMKKGGGVLGGAAAQAPAGKKAAVQVPVDFSDPKSSAIIAKVDSTHFDVVNLSYHSHSNVFWSLQATIRVTYDGTAAESHAAIRDTAKAASKNAIDGISELDFKPDEMPTLKLEPDKDPKYAGEEFLPNELEVGVARFTFE